MAKWQRICLQGRRPRLDPWVGKIPWSRKWQPTPEFLPGESHGLSSLVGYSPKGYRVGHDRSDLAHTHASLGRCSWRVGRVFPEPWPLMCSRTDGQLFIAGGDRANIRPYGEGAGIWHILILENCLIPGEPGRVAQGNPELDL